MPISHVLLTFLVVVVWGFNFLFVKLGLDEMSPLLLCALRFFLASVPALFFIRPPVGSIRLVAVYGLVMFALQFSLLFTGMALGMPPGMASLLMQTQVFFSMFFAVLFLGEQPQITQVLGAMVSFVGIGVVASHFDAHVSLGGFLCILAGAATWGVGNLITKKIKSVHFITVIVWGSFMACFPMLLLVLMVEGTESFLYTYEHLSWKGLGSLFYIVYASTWVGYGIWNWLISRYPVNQIVPFTLLVPVVGILSSVIFLGEPFQLWKLVAGLLVISGLSINVLGSRILVSKVRPEMA